jgi:hypothetical protein
VPDPAALDEQVAQAASPLIGPTIGEAFSVVAAADGT